MERMEWIVVTQDPAKTGQIAPGRTVCLPGARNAAAENAGAEWLLFWQENLTPAAGFGEAVAAALEEYKSWQSERLGRSINPDELRRRVLTAGACRLDLTSPIYEAVASDKVAIASSASALTYKGRLS